MEELFKLFKEVCDHRNSKYGMMYLQLYSDESGAFQIVRHWGVEEYDEFQSIAEAITILLKLRDEKFTEENKVC